MRKSQATLSRQQINSPKTSIEALQKALEVEAKRANTRLRALEKSGLQKSSRAYKAVRDFGADNRDFVETKGNLRFSRSVKGKTREQLQEELNQLHVFLYEAKTSTVSGVKETKKKIKEATAAQNETGTKSQAVQDFFRNMTEEEFEKFWNLANVKRFYDMFGSDETVNIIEEAAKNPNIGYDMDLLNMALGDILNDYNKSLESVIAELEEYTPTGEIL